MMKLLILSNSEWDDSNSFGSSFSNILGNIEGLDIANIYCREGSPNTKSTETFFQITESCLIRNLTNSSHPSGHKIVQQKNKLSNGLDKPGGTKKSITNFIKTKRWIIFFWIREVIWYFGRWKSKELQAFIDEFDPDIIFLPIYYSVYLNKIGLYLQTSTSKPMLGYISDDNYTLNQFSLSPLFWIDRFIKRRWVKKAAKACEILYVISSIQKRDYDKAFAKDCKVLYKGADFKNMPVIHKKNPNEIIELTYAGNIGDGRYLSLEQIGRALEKIYKDTGKMGILNIYSPTIFTSKMKAVLLGNTHIKFHGKVGHHKLKEIYENSDILIHVESLKLKDRLQVRHSFSTKIVDYFAAHRCIFAIGWEKAASIDYLIKNDAAVVATNENEIAERLQMLWEHPEFIISYGQKAWDCGKKNHQIDEIQAKLLNDFNYVMSLTNENFTD